MRGLNSRFPLLTQQSALLMTCIVLVSLLSPISAADPVPPSAIDKIVPEKKAGDSPATEQAIPEKTPTAPTPKPVEVFTDPDLTLVTPGSNKREFSGIYPHLASFNEQGECGTGAVVPWAGKLWWVTYAPHKPLGSDDKLYALDAERNFYIYSKSIGGTPANRMIHRESQQLFIGPYAINEQGKIRTIPYTEMYGRPTGNARHLTDPANKIYYATMEEGLYEVDVHSLKVTELWRDEQVKEGKHSALPGYHGKGLYSGYGEVIYANNGDHEKAALTNPATASGVLATWDGKGDWHVVRRNQFTEVTGPGGIYGNTEPDKDPVWTIGWDHRSLIFMCLHAGKWHTYRLPKGSHSYDGAHGWNTEWPRIREIGEQDFLMTMHGTFWKFPAHFTPEHSAGIAPHSNYIKVVGDFCRYGDQIVLGCDDTAASEFLNKRDLKGDHHAKSQSQSNLRFIKPEELDQMGPAIGRGAVWVDEDITKDVPSDPYLFAGYEHRSLLVTHNSPDKLILHLEMDEKGDGNWEAIGALMIPAGQSGSTYFTDDQEAAWIRLKPATAGTKVTAMFQYRQPDHRSTTPDTMFEGIAKPNASHTSAGLLHVRAENKKTLRFVTTNDQNELVGYDFNQAGTFAKVDDKQGIEYVQKNVALADKVITVDELSVLYVDKAGKRWRLPKGDAAFDDLTNQNTYRVCREVCTERDMVNVHGSFYELPAENAGGFSKIRPIATHNHFIKDYASYCGLLVLSGVSLDAPETNSHIVFSDDHKQALWVGCVDDLWKFGKARGTGNFWKDQDLKEGVTTDPYLMTGYDKKSITFKHAATKDKTFHVEVDLTGNGNWARYKTIKVKPKETLVYKFPTQFSAYWVRTVADEDIPQANVRFDYE